MGLEAAKRQKVQNSDVDHIAGAKALYNKELKLPKSRNLGREKKRILPIHSLYLQVNININKRHLQKII